VPGKHSLFKQINPAIKILVEKSEALKMGLAIRAKIKLDLQRLYLASVNSNELCKI
jgi:hypothetical protein